MASEFCIRNWFSSKDKPIKSNKKHFLFAPEGTEMETGYEIIEWYIGEKSVAMLTKHNIIQAHQVQSLGKKKYILLHSSR